MNLSSTEAATPPLATPASAAKVLPYRRSAAADRGATGFDLYFPSRLRDLVIPAVLLLVSAILAGAESIHLVADPAAAVAVLVAYFVVKVVMMMVCIPIIARVAGVSFGSLPSAVLKFGSIALLPDALGVGVMILMPGCYTVILAIAVAFIACWTLFAVLFQLDLTESRFAAAVYFGIGIAFSFLWFGLFSSLLELAP